MRPFQIGNFEIAAGQQALVKLPVSVLANDTPINLPVQVIHGANAGPVFFLSAVVHGDEIAGVEIVRRVLDFLKTQQLIGTLLAVPIVNAYGFLHHMRYMPDRRDLNRSFPGSDKGSLASLLADLFMQEVVMRAQYGIDLHTAANHRNNLPQIRIASGDQELKTLAESFAAPVILATKLREGSLRQSARDEGVKVLLYEGGEAFRFEEESIQMGVAGVLRVMAHLGMIAEAPLVPAYQPCYSHSSTWVRAPEGGVLRHALKLGTIVRRGDLLGEISSPLGENKASIIAEEEGIIIGGTSMPLANKGDALFHLARLKREDLPPVSLFDEDEII